MVPPNQVRAIETPWTAFSRVILEGKSLTFSAAPQDSATTFLIEDWVSRVGSNLGKHNRCHAKMQFKPEG
jgi:hypothetical protein